MLKGLAEGLLQFVPKGWLIHLGGNEDLVFKVVTVIDRLVSHESNIFLSEEQVERKARIIEEIRLLLKSPHKKDFVS